MSTSLRDKAVRLRKRGWSYNIISRRLGVSRSTLSGWLKHAPYSPNQAVLKRIRTGPRISGERRRAKRIAETREAKNLACDEIGQVSKRDLLMLGIGLYIGEGVKQNEQVRFANSDPAVIKTIMRWFRSICGVPNEHFRITVHSYPDIPMKKVLSYWSVVTELPQSQFLRTQVDHRASKRINKGKLPYGTLHITVNACGNKELGVMLHRRIMGWIETVYNKTIAGVV